MKDLLNSVAVLSTFITAVGIIYIVLNATVGKMKFINGIVLFKSLQLKHIVFIAIAVVLILNYSTFYKPW